MDGILVVRKEAGYTSNDVVAVVRGILHTRRIGHTGTLDPDATGVLPVCIGGATRAVELLMAERKVYRAEMVFGFETDTQDLGGQVTERRDYVFSREAFDAAVRKWTGDILQVPPMYSARKVGGVRLYDLARRGRDVVREPKPVTIHQIQVDAVDESGAVLTIICSKGTYIRSLVTDIGRDAGFLATMSRLERLQSGRFTLDQSQTIKQIEDLAHAGHIEEYILSLDSLFADDPPVTVEAAEDKLLLNGNPLKIDAEKIPPEARVPGSHLRMYTSDHRFIGLYEVQTAGDICRVRAFKMFISS